MYSSQLKARQDKNVSGLVLKKLGLAS